MIVHMTDFDLAPLAETGKRRKQNRTEAEDIRETIERQIREAAAAGAIQARIVEAAGMTREAVAQILRPKEERWKRAAKPVAKKARRSR